MWSSHDEDQHYHRMMANFTFSELSPDEFENLSRDLLQAEEGIRLESFKTGKDGGIDFRYATDGQSLIVQCKHFAGSKLSDLIKSAKAESAKIKRLKPSRYVFITSLGLTPKNKEQIRDALDINVASSDIWSQDDLNNLLELHSPVLRSNFKLWLSSSAVLDRIISAPTYFQSDFEEKRTKREISRYVQTQLSEKLSIYSSWSGS